MPSVVVLVLIGLWGAVLLPPLMRHRPARPARASGSPLAMPVAPQEPAAVSAATVDSPRRVVRPTLELVDVVETPAVPAEDQGDPPDPLMPRSAAEARRRRQMVLATLTAVAIAALAAAPLVGPRALIGHGVVDLVLAGYGWLVFERDQRARQRSDVVRPLSPTRRATPGFMVDERFLDRGRRAG